MASMRVRKPFAAAFTVLLLGAAYLGLSTNKIPSYGQSDKGLHFLTFFLLTITFYWILETTRRRCVHLTLVICTAGLSIGSEVVQALLPNGRDFDLFDIIANVVGSTLALLLCSWYHKRMLERKRASKNYHIVPGDELDPERDVELGEGAQESGVVRMDEDATAGAKPTVSEELDNWDENAEDWDAPEGEESGSGEGQKTPASSADESADMKKSKD